nr:heparanase-like protein 1 [Tanacetum cinerariifolium]
MLASRNYPSKSVNDPPTLRTPKDDDYDSDEKEDEEIFKERKKFVTFSFQLLEDFHISHEGVIQVRTSASSESCCVYSTKKEEPVGLTEFAFTIQQQGFCGGYWNSTNARDFIKYTVSKGYKIDSWEFEVHSKENSSYKISSVDKDKDPQQKDLKIILALSTYFVFSIHKR